MGWIAVGKTHEFPLGEIKEVLIDGGVMAIARTPSGFRAFDNNCAHMGVALSRGRIEGETVICPLYNWAYDLRTARITYPPNGGRFSTFFTKVEGDTVMVWPAVRSEEDIQCETAACPAQKVAR
jgi:nitrite reductase/ring-hydroxylating ferredoxin subunit